MSGPKRNADKVNTIGIVVIGICGAVLTYVSIVALQAFYISDSSEVQTMADYGGQERTFQSIRADQMSTLKTYRPNALPPAGKDGTAPPQTYVIPIDQAIRLVVQGAKADPANLVPAIGPAVKPTVKEIYGRPVVIPSGPAPGAGSAPAPADGAGSAAAPAAGAPAGAPEGPGAGSSAPMTPTAGQAQGGGAPPGAEGQPVKDAGGGPAAPKEPAATPKEPATAPKKGNAS